MPNWLLAAVMLVTAAALALLLHRAVVRLMRRLISPKHEFLQSLPPSVLSVMGTAQGDDVVPMRTASVWEYDLHTDYAISGSRSLSLTLER